jgi:hypothetical protein
MFDNNRVGSNAPILTGASLTEEIALTGGGTFDDVWGRSSALFTYEGVYHMLISNIGTANVWVGNSLTVKGVLLQPGASLNLSVGREATVYAVRDAAGAGALTAILFR